jgi:hypothetical protein
MKLKFYIFICLMGIAAFFCGCKKFVEIDPPTTQLVTSGVFNNNSAATAAQTVIYSLMANNDESGNMAMNLGLLSDELTNYNIGNIIEVQYYTNAMAASQNPGPWDNGYNYVYQANAVISQVQGNASLNPTVAQQLLGEAKFIRAFWLFYLTNLYGDIPLVVSTDYKINATISRTARAQVYQQVIADLKDAQNLLNPNYIGPDDTTISTTDRTRPNKWAAAALLARVYLFTGDYSNAALESDSIIRNSSVYSLVPNLDSVFLANSNEAIWQLGIPQPSNYNTNDGVDFILLSPPGTGTTCCSISPQLLNSFDSGDNRRLQWVDSFTTTTPPIITYYGPYKYKVRDQTSVTEQVMVLRLAEQFLIRAEANAHQGNIPGAINDLNMIRNRAGLSNYNGGQDQQSILTAILHERQVELFSEWGHRWLDIIRTNSADSIMSIVTPQKGGQWNQNGYQTLFPIPQADRITDGNLSQNLGY